MGPVTILNQISDRDLECRALDGGGMDFCERYRVMVQGKAGRLLYTRTIWPGAEKVETSFCACHLSPTIIGFEFGRI